MSNSEDRLQKAREQHDRGKERIAKGIELHTQGYSNAEIASKLEIPESAVRMLLDGRQIQDHETIWFPGIYNGRDYKPWTRAVNTMSDDRLIALVQKRAKEDGEWAIKNGFVGNNEDKMRQMMAWVSDETNIRQCVAHLCDEETKRMVQHEVMADPDDEDFDEFEPRTVDYICRDLANASKWVGGSR